MQRYKPKNKIVVRLFQISIMYFCGIDLKKSV